MMILLKLLNLLFAMSLIVAHEEIWVAVDDRLDVMFSQTNFSIVLPSVKRVIGISNPSFHDSNNTLLYVTTLDAKGPALYEINKQSPVFLAKDSSKSTYFEDVAYDQFDSKLYVTSKSNNAIYSLNTKTTDTEMKIFYQHRNKSPSAIAINPCSRQLFWTNSNRQHASIEVSDPLVLNSSTTIISNGLTAPRALAIDINQQRLYWSDTRRGTFKIESSLFNGSGREIIANGNKQEPFSLVVGEEFLYWTDWTSHALWRVPKLPLSQDANKNPQLIRSFPGSRPHGVSIIPQQPYMCNTNSPLASINTELAVEKHTNIGIKDDSNVSKVANDSVQNDDRGNMEIIKEQIVEARNICSSYCFGRGACVINPDNTPICLCSESRSGKRCEQDLCLNYCLEGGKCIVIEGRPECLCSKQFTGERCQLNITHTNSKTILDDQHHVIIFGLAAVIAVLVIIVIGLLIVITRLRKRPRIIRKRFISIGNKDRNCGMPVENGVALDIENCCNMTLCDTPCFEPSTRSPRKLKENCADRRALLETEGHGHDNDAIDF